MKTIGRRSGTENEVEEGARREREEWELAEEQELPAGWASDEWVGDLQTRPWKERKDRLDQLAEHLTGVQRLSQRTNVAPIVTLAMQTREANVLAQLSAIKVVGLLARCLRRSFHAHARLLLPWMLAKLRERNRHIVEEAFNAIELLQLALGAEEAVEEFLETLNEVPPERKPALLRLLCTAVDRLRPAQASRITKAAGQLLEKGENGAAAELITQLNARFPEKVMATLHELGPNVTANVARAMANGMPNNRISDCKAETRGALEESLLCLSAETDSFKQISAGDRSNALDLLAEACLAADEAPLTDGTRLLVAQLFAEQLSDQFDEKLCQTFDLYVNTRHCSLRTFIADIIEALSQRTTLATPALIKLLELIEREPGAVSLRALSDFFQRFLAVNAEPCQRPPALRTLRIVSARLGERALNDFPLTLIRELESAVAEQSRLHSQILARLGEKSLDRKKQAVQDLLALTDFSRIGQCWAQPALTSFLKRSLITETNTQAYRALFQVQEQYLRLKLLSPADFSLRSFLLVFSTAIQHFFDSASRGERAVILKEGFTNTVTALTPGLLFQELLNGGEALATREQVLGFYRQYPTEITPSARLIDYINETLTDRRMAEELRPLIVEALIAMKRVALPELLARGNEVAFIREVWLRDDEEKLFDVAFFQGGRGFQEETLFFSAKELLGRAIEVDNASFFTKSVDVHCSVGDPRLRSKLVYFLLRSTENYTPLAETIFKEISLFSPTDLDDICFLLCARIAINLLKSLYHNFKGELFQRVREFFQTLISAQRFTLESLLVTLELNSRESNFVQIVVSAEEECEASRSDQFSGRNERADIATEGEEERELSEQLTNLLEMDLGLLQNASRYFMRLCSDPNSAAFLAQHGSQIVEAFTLFIDTLFGQGVDAGVEKQDLDLLFVPLLALCSAPGLLEALPQELLNDFVHQISYRLMKANEERTSLEAAGARAKADFEAHIVKNLNSALLRVIDFSEPNNLLSAIFSLIFLRRDRPNEDSSALSVLAFKILARIMKGFARNIAQIDGRTLFGLSRRYLDSFGDSDRQGYLAVKSIVTEFVRLSDSEYVWDCYRVVFAGEREGQLAKWIRIVQSRLREQREGKRPPNAAVLKIIEALNTRTDFTRNNALIEELSRLAASEDIDLRLYENEFARRETFESILQRIHQDNSTFPAQTKSARFAPSAARSIDDFLNKTESHSGELRRLH